jgi:chromatin remodeling complex protein RSC6
MKRLWAYLKANNLQDPENKQWFTPDKKMALVFGSEKIKAFGMTKYLKNHLS